MRLELKEICFAGGCFWGVEKYFWLIEGVVETSVGYANGITEKPSYDDVCSGLTKHAEAIYVKYDASIIDLPSLLDLYYKIINPTSINKQGPDEGLQYRTGIYYIDELDKEIVNGSIEELQKSFDKPIQIEVLPLENYYLAEDYHQKYLEKNVNGYCHISF